LHDHRDLDLTLDPDEAFRARQPLTRRGPLYRRLIFGIETPTEIIDLSVLWRGLICPNHVWPENCTVDTSVWFEALRRKILADLTKKYPLLSGHSWVCWISEEGFDRL
jgi:hypothetical protein